MLRIAHRPIELMPRLTWLFKFRHNSCYSRGINTLKTLFWNSLLHFHFHFPTRTLPSFELVKYTKIIPFFHTKLPISYYPQQFKLKHVLLIRFQAHLVGFQSNKLIIFLTMICIILFFFKFSISKSMKLRPQCYFIFVLCWCLVAFLFRMHIL